MNYIILFLTIILILTGCERKKFTPKRKSAKYYVNKEIESSNLMEKELIHNKKNIKNRENASNMIFEHADKKQMKLNRAIIFKNEGKYYKAIDLLLDVLENDSKNISILENILELYILTKDNVAIKKYSQKIIDLDDKNSFAIQTMANILMEDNNLNSALDFYEKLLEIKPSAISYYNIALLYLKKHDTNKALKLLKKSNSLKESSNTNYQIALIYENLGDEEKMLLYLEKSAKSYDATIKSVSLLGNKYFKLKKYSEALNIFKKLTKIRKNPNDIKNLAIAYQFNKDFYNAITNYNSYLDKVQNDRDALYNLALCYYELGKANKMDLTIKRYSNHSKSITKTRHLKVLLSKLRKK